MLHIKLIEKEFEKLPLREKLKEEDLKTLVRKLSYKQLKQRLHRIINLITIDKTNLEFMINTYLDFVDKLSMKEIIQLRDDIIEEIIQSRK